VGNILNKAVVIYFYLLENGLREKNFFVSSTCSARFADFLCPRISGPVIASPLPTKLSRAGFAM
jgi:hypothetical protein